MKTTNEQSQTAEATKTAKKATNSAKSTKQAESHKFQSSSAYGVTVEALCMKPDASKEEILKTVTDAGIDVKASKNAVQTGISQAKKVIQLLRSNELMK